MWFSPDKVDLKKKSLKNIMIALLSTYWDQINL